MRRERRFWIMLVTWLALGLPTLVGTAWFRSHGLPVPDLPKTEKGVAEVIGWFGIILFIYATPIVLVIDELRFRRLRRTGLENHNAEH
ncbi:hypothetical protein [Sphingomonas mesophila]|uniref:hypothetical protein n=1 Tax=Sphingomonas mesophila TaxID=2303576 RepID=UPI0013C2AB13|nr:hypothetical protein [Sphingomonas mesophila]